MLEKTFSTRILTSSLLVSLIGLTIACENRETRYTVKSTGYSGNVEADDQLSSGSDDTSSGSGSSVPDKNPAPQAPATPAAAVSSISVALSPIIVETTHDSFFPRAIKLANAKMIAVYAANIDTFQTIRTVVSEDEGKSWHEFGEIFRETSTPDRFLSDPAVVQLPSGAVVAIFKNNSFGVQKLLASVSVDNGFTWTPQGEVSSALAANVLDARQPSIVVTAKGELRVFYAKEKVAGGDTSIVMRSSSDEGKTWSPEIKTVSVAKGSTTFPGVTRLIDGSLLMVYDAPRSDFDNRLGILAAQSNDDGLTWVGPSNVYLPVKVGKNAKAPQLTLLEDGRAMVAFNSDEDTAQGLGCCSIKLLISDATVTFTSLKWAAQAVTAIDGTENLFPSLLNKNKDELILVYENSKKLFTNKVIIGGPK